MKPHNATFLKSDCAGRLCQADQLKQFVAQVFEAHGAPSDIAGEVARHLVRSDLSGHSSHGVIQVPHYVLEVDRGELLPSARPAVVRETGITGIIDAKRGMGHFSTAFALDWAIERADRHGACVATIRHSTHIGRVGEYTERAAERGFIAIVVAGAAGPGIGSMILHGTKTCFLATNPWSIGVPTNRETPVVYDGASSTVAEGKIRLRHAKGEPAPPDCIVNSQGQPSTHPEDLIAGGAMLPLGGPTAAHKGSGFALIAALLGSLGMIDDAEPTFIGAPVVPHPDPRGRLGGVMVIVIAPSAFGDPACYRALTGETVGAAKRVPPASGIHEVLVPGEFEQMSRSERARDGIPLAEATWEALAKIGERFSIVMPPTRRAPVSS